MADELTADQAQEVYARTRDAILNNKQLASFPTMEGFSFNFKCTACKAGLAAGIGGAVAAVAAIAIAGGVVIGPATAGIGTIAAVTGVAAVTVAAIVTAAVAAAAGAAIDVITGDIIEALCEKMGAC